MPKFELTGEWIMRGTLTVDAENEREAIDKGYETKDLPEGTFAKGTFEIVNVDPILEEEE